jgi:hypothetical protein
VRDRRCTRIKARITFLDKENSHFQDHEPERNTHAPPDDHGQFCRQPLFICDEVQAPDEQASDAQQRVKAAVLMAIGVPA